MAHDTMRSGGELIAAGLLSPERQSEIDAVASRYAVAVTDDIAALMDRDDPNEPVARQYPPSAAELDAAREERADPIGDARRSPVKGVVHRYPDRVLLTPLHACAVYCRFCFRREAVGPGKAALTPDELHDALNYIRAHAEIWEVILTGGDPLMLSPRRLKELIAALSAIEHVAVVRIHTRVPMAAPRRVTAKMVAALATEKALWVSIHANHANEFGPDQRAALARLTGAVIPLVGQSVLLRGVNDDAAVLEKLFRAMVAHRIKPYYLHHPDLARGTGHFRVGLDEGQGLMRRLRGHVSGLCQPGYVLDIPGGYGKVPVGPGYVRRAERGWVVEDPSGVAHDYPPPSRDVLE